MSASPNLTIARHLTMRDPSFARGIAEAVSWMLALPHDQNEDDVARAWADRPASAEGDALTAWLRDRLAADYERQQAEEAECQAQRRAEANVTYGLSGPRPLDGDMFGRALS